MSPSYTCIFFKESISSPITSSALVYLNIFPFPSQQTPPQPLFIWESHNTLAPLCVPHKKPYKPILLLLSISSFLYKTFSVLFPPFFFKCIFLKIFPFSILLCLFVDPSLNSSIIDSCPPLFPKTNVHAKIKEITNNLTKICVKNNNITNFSTIMKYTFFHKFQDVATWNIHAHPLLAPLLLHLVPLLLHGWDSTFYPWFCPLFWSILEPIGN